jgi:probable rRNA maturation factor
VGLRIAVTDARGRAVPAAGLIRWLQRVAPPAARGDLAIALVTDREMRTLNRHYRQIDRPTDVLSFGASRRPQALRPCGGLRPHPDAEYLGDIAIATGVAARQARAEGHSPATEFKILALHGLLHLLGYDHDDPADAGRMARVERRLRRKGGLRTGLIERSA